MRYETFLHCMTEGCEDQIPGDSQLSRRFYSTLEQIYDAIRPRTRKQAEKCKTIFWASFDTGRRTGKTEGRQISYDALEGARVALGKISDGLINDLYKS